MSESNITPLPGVMPPAGWPQPPAWPPGPMPPPWPPGPMPPPAPPDCFNAFAKLMSCYDDVRMAEAFLSKVMIGLIETNPAVTQAMINAIQKSGSNVPLIGVTNGTDAQPGQVGEWVSFASPLLSFPATSNSQTTSLGILQPGDWDVWLWADISSAYNYAEMQLSPIPAGFNSSLFVAGAASGGDDSSLVSNAGRALISVPSPIVLQFNTNPFSAGPGSGTATLFFAARRMR